MKKLLSLLSLTTMITMGGCSQVKNNPIEVDQTNKKITIHKDASETKNQFIKASGSDLTLKNKKINLKGIGFSNYVFIKEDELREEPDLIIHNSHHSLEAYRDVHDMGMNTVRFDMHYKMIEEKPFVLNEKGLKWLDSNIAAAREQGIFIILNLHILPGDVDGEKNFWLNEYNRKRVIFIWEELAKRYKNETAIAGYDLINEPVVQNSKNEYTSLIDQLIRAIRANDQNHLLIVERLYGVGEDWSTWNNPSFSQFTVEDDNVMYDFHFYYPEIFTLQGTIDGYEKIGSFPNEKEIDLHGITGKADKNFMTKILDAFVEFGKQNNVPMNVGEFGVNNTVFYGTSSSIDNLHFTDNGGLLWTATLIDLMDKRNLNYQYHAYHEQTFGLYPQSVPGEYANPRYLPNPQYRNDALRNLFIKKGSSSKHGKILSTK